MNPLDTLTQQIRTVLRDHGRLSRPLDGVADDADLYQSGMTSHASVNVMLALEDEFDVEFPERFLKRTTFESIENLSVALADLVHVDA